MSLCDFAEGFGDAWTHTQDGIQVIPTIADNKEEWNKFQFTKRYSHLKKCNEVSQSLTFWNKVMSSYWKKKNSPGFCWFPGYSTNIPTHSVSGGY